MMSQLVFGQVLNGLIVGALYGIVALGVSLTFGITGIVNFALGAFMMVGAYLTWFARDVAGLPYPLAAASAVLVVGALGVAVDQGLFRFTRNHLVNGLLVSIGLISVFEAAALMLWTSTPKEMAYVVSGSLEIGGIWVPRAKLMVFAVLLLVIGSTYLALTRTKLGKAAFAFAQNPEAAMLMGVPTALLQSAIVVYSTMLAGLGGALYAAIYSIEPTIGSEFVLKAVEGAILAGIGSILGALGGGALIGVTEGVGSIFLPLAFRDAYGLLLLVLVLLVKPAGLFSGRRS